MSLQLGCASQEYRRVETFWCSDDEWCQLYHDNLVYDADLLSSEVLKRQVIKMGGGVCLNFWSTGSHKSARCENERKVDA